MYFPPVTKPIPRKAIIYCLAWLFLLLLTWFIYNYALNIPGLLPLFLIAGIVFLILMFKQLGKLINWIECMLGHNRILSALDRMEQRRVDMGGKPARELESRTIQLYGTPSGILEKRRLQFQNETDRLLNNQDEGAMSPKSRTWLRRNHSWIYEQIYYRHFEEGPLEKLPLEWEIVQLRAAVLAGMDRYDEALQNIYIAITKYLEFCDELKNMEPSGYGYYSDYSDLTEDELREEIREQWEFLTDEEFEEMKEEFPDLFSIEDTDGDSGDPSRQDAYYIVELNEYRIGDGSIFNSQIEYYKEQILQGEN